MTTPPSTPPPGRPPASPPPTHGAPGPSFAPASTPSFDWRRLLVGNWLGAATVAGTTLATAGLLGLVTALLVKPPGLSLGHVLELSTMLATSAFGVRVSLSGGYEDVEASGSLGVTPLTLTVVILVVAALAFRRVVRDYPSPGAALGDAARTALLVGVGLMAVAIAFRGDNDDLGRGWGRELSADETDVRVDFGAHVAGSLFVGFLVTFVVLALVVVARRDWWSERVQGFHDRLAAPLYGYLPILLLLPLIGLVGFLLLGFGEESLDEVEEETNLRELLTVVFVLLGNGGVWLLGLGSGAGIGGRLDYSGDGESGTDQDYQRLWGAVTDDEPGLWASPVILVLVLALSAYLVVRRSRSRERALGNLAVWLGGLVVLVPVLVLLANARGSGDADFDGSDYEASAVGGVDGVETTFFVLGVAFLVALVVSLLTGALTAEGLRRGLARVQSHPGRPAQPGPPPSYAPPSYDGPTHAPPTSPPSTSPPPDPGRPG